MPAVLLVCMVVLCAVVLTLCVLYRPEKVENQVAADAEEKTEEQDAAGSQTEEERIRQEAQEILTRMTVEEKVGQMFIARCPEESAAKKAAEYHLGGYILFARDFENKTEEQVISEIQSYQEASALPMLIGVDEEGGSVTRISRYPEFRDEPFASSQTLY